MGNLRDGRDAMGVQAGRQLRPIEECLHGLICCAIGDGNFLFNVGPRPDGLIEPSHAARLREMGAFMKQYGESIYATRGGPFIAPDDRSVLPTRAVLHWRKATGGAAAPIRERDLSAYSALAVGHHPLPSIPRKIVRHSLLTGGECSVKQTEAGLRLPCRRVARQPVDTIVKLELDGPANTIPILREG